MDTQSIKLETTAEEIASLLVNYYNMINYSNCTSRKALVLTVRSNVLCVEYQ